MEAAKTDFNDSGLLTHAFNESVILRMPRDRPGSAFDITNQFEQQPPLQECLVGDGSERMFLFNCVKYFQAFEPR